ncbi:MAG: hypothetical protein J0M13_11165 [Candidatus Accumulibacter sp.]|jgi:hypothetical protein|nr:hypothetical protein [Candidatus Accumulibacter necessarius]
MSQEANDTGVAAVIIERLEKERLPRALDLKAKVEAGGRLDDMDIAFLERVFADSEDLKPLLDRHPEYNELASRMMRLYQEITARGLENEK